MCAKKSWFRKRLSHKSAILTIRRALSFYTSTLFRRYFPHYDVWAIFVCVCMWNESHELCVKRWAFDRVHKWIANRAIDKMCVMENLRFIFCIMWPKAYTHHEWIYSKQSIKKIPHTTHHYHHHGMLWCMCVVCFFPSWMCPFDTHKQAHLGVHVFTRKNSEYILEIMKMW